MASREETTVTSEISDDRQRRLNRKRQSNYRRRHNNNSTGIRLELGRMDQVCIHCGAKFWMNEKDQRSSQHFTTFSICCAGGKVSLPSLLRPPPYLMNCILPRI